MKIEKILVLIICMAVSHVSAQAVFIPPVKTPLERGSTINVFPSQKRAYREVRYINFQVNAERYLGDSILVVDLITSENIEEKRIYYRLKRNKGDYLAENYLQIVNGKFSLEIPDFKDDESIIFSIGWYLARPDYFKADIHFISPEAPTRHKTWKGDDYKD